MRTSLLATGFAGWLTVVSVSAATLAQPADREPQWLTESRLQRQLLEPVGITWRDNPLRDALTNLGRTQHVAIVLDRRVDPSRLITYDSGAQLPLRGVLDELASRTETRFAMIGDIIFMAPAQQADPLATAAELRAQQAERLPAATRSLWMAKKPWSWDELATPQQLVAELAAEGRFELENPAALPHDLWPATDLPPTSLVNRLSLVLAGFQQTFEWVDGGTKVRIVPIAAELTVRLNYDVPRQAAEIVGRLRRDAPAATVRQRRATAPKKGIELTLVGTWNDHQTLRSLLAKNEPTRPGAVTEVRYSLRVENQELGRVARALGAKLKRQVEFDPRINNKLDQRISFEVRDATLDQLLRAMLKSSGLRFDLDAAKLRIHP